MNSPSEIPQHQENQAAEGVRLFPDLFISGLTVLVLALSAYSVLCIFFPAGLDVRADPLSRPPEVKPAWYFLFLHGLLRSTPPLVRSAVPLLLLFGIAAWPFLDRSDRRSGRVARAVTAAVVVSGLLVLTYLGWRA